jgi:hypothetical protein
MTNDSGLKSVNLETEIAKLDSAKKRKQAPDARSAERQILDQSSSSKIHLWSKSKI